ncbi:MAG: dihydrofolate reductase [Saprospiraceae bacterium]|nr:dihydrofolate reductase [Saprospiraceae bacterium]
MLIYNNGQLFYGFQHLFMAIQNEDNKNQLPVPTVSIISAFAKNHVMGLDGVLPWSLPDDWKNFKTVTKDKAFLMGRKSYESEDYLGSDYKNFILTSNPQLEMRPNCQPIHSIADFLREIKEEEEVFILGGGKVFAEALKMGVVDKMYLTLINAEPEGDTFFPELAWADWEEIESVYHPIDEQHAYEFHIKTYIKKQ